MSLILITGGNKGLGYEAARRLITLGHRVYIGCRNEERGRTAASRLGAEYLPLEVTDDCSVTRAAEKLAAAEGHLDVLINNAGVSAAFIKPEQINAQEMQRVYDVNVFGTVRMIHAFLPLLRRSENPVIVNVSSGLGSFGTVTDPASEESKFASPAYCSSKAAVSMLTLQFAKAFPDIKINCADPGASDTDLNGHRGKQTVTEGTDAIIKLALIGKDGPSGIFINRYGNMPW